MTNDEFRVYLRDWRRRNPEKVKASLRRYEAANRAKRTAWKRQWRKKNPEKAKAAAQRAQQRRLQTLPDNYIRQLLAQGSELSPKDFPPELVELKRQHLTAKRLLQSYQADPALPGPPEAA